MAAPVVAVATEARKSVAMVEGFTGRAHSYHFLPEVAAVGERATKAHLAVPVAAAVERFSSARKLQFGLQAESCRAVMAAAAVAIALPAAVAVPVAPSSSRRPKSRSRESSRRTVVAVAAVVTTSVLGIRVSGDGTRARQRAAVPAAVRTRAPVKSAEPMTSRTASPLPGGAGMVAVVAEAWAGFGSTRSLARRR